MESLGPVNATEARNEGIAHVQAAILLVDSGRYAHGQACATVALACFEAAKILPGGPT